MNRISRETKEKLTQLGRPTHRAAMTVDLRHVASLRAVHNEFVGTILSAAPLTQEQKSARAARELRNENIRHGFVQAHRMIAIRNALRAGREDHPLLKTLLVDARRIGISADNKMDAAKALLAHAMNALRTTRASFQAPSRLSSLRTVTEKMAAY